MRRAGIDVGATYVVEGSVRRIGSRRRIVVRLVNAETRTLLWCDRFDGTLAARFAFHDTVANQVASAICQTVRNAEMT